MQDIADIGLFRLKKKNIEKFTNSSWNILRDIWKYLENERREIYS